MRLTIGSYLKPLFLSLCLIGTVVNAKDKKIYVLADIHVMSPSLIDNVNNKQWQEYLTTCKTMQDLSVAIFDALTDKIITDQPDLLLIAGDLTKDSEVSSHEYVLNKLTHIRQSGIPVYVVPGNHDRGWMQRALIYVNDTCTATEMIDNDGFAERYKDFGYGSQSERYGETLNYVTEPFPGLTLIGIDSGIWVTYREGSIDWACGKAKEAMAKGNQVIVMIHHPIMPHYYYQDKIFELSVAENYQEILEKFTDAGIKVVLTGHSHTSDISRFTDNYGKEIYDVGTGSPISFPCDFRILSFNDALSELTITTKSLTELAGFKDFPSYAKERLRESVSNWTEKWFIEKTNADEEENELAINIIRQALSNAFIIHAMGNEPRNPDTAEALKLYNDILHYVPRLDITNADLITDISLSMKSLLGDYPSEEESENVVDDRNLVIHMPILSNGIYNIQADNDESKYWYSLQGIRYSTKPVRPGIYLHQGHKVIIR